MSNVIDWPLTPATFGGFQVIEDRVKLSQRDSGAGSFALVENRGRQGLKVVFWRNVFSVKLEFRGAGLNGLALVAADVKNLITGHTSMSIMVRKGRGKTGRVGVAFDDARGYMVSFDNQGDLQSLGLPFPEWAMTAVPQATQEAFAMSGCSLASWASTLLVALCRHDDAAVADTMAIVEGLCAETEGQFDDLIRVHDLECGTGMAKLRFEPGRSGLV
jgi:hypothetical protein